MDRRYCQVTIYYLNQIQFEQNANQNWLSHHKLHRHLHYQYKQNIYYLAVKNLSCQYLLQRLWHHSHYYLQIIIHLSNWLSSLHGLIGQLADQLLFLLLVYSLVNRFRSSFECSALALFGLHQQHCSLAFLHMTTEILHTDHSFHTEKWYLLFCSTNKFEKPP